MKLCSYAEIFLVSACQMLMWVKKKKLWSPACVQHGGVPPAVCGDRATALSRDPVPALTDRRGPDGADGDAGVCPGQVMIEFNRHSTWKHTYGSRKLSRCLFNVITYHTGSFYFYIRNNRWNWINGVFYTTHRYTPEQQEALVSNVFLTGGNMQYPGMKERVERELLAMRPFQSHFKVPSPPTILRRT